MRLFVVFGLVALLMGVGVLADLYSSTGKVNDLCYVPEWRDHCGPHFVVIGSMKCGTTSLFNYLLSHPQVLPLKDKAKIMGKQVVANKEVRFFMDPTFPSALGLKETVHDALDIYYDIFPEIKPVVMPTTPYDQQVTGEATPMYVNQNIAERVKLVYEHGKLLWLMRNPIDRAYSDYWFINSLGTTALENEDRVAWESNTAMGWEFCASAEMARLEFCNVTEYLHGNNKDAMAELDRCVGNITTTLQKVKGICSESSEYYPMCVGDDMSRYCKGNSFMRYGLYYFQLLNWIDHFGSSQLKIVSSEDFYSETPRVMDEITEFLGLQPMNWTDITRTAFNIVKPNTATMNNVQMENGVPHKLGMGALDHSQTASYPKMRDAFRQQLIRFFQPFNQKLSILVHQPELNWSE